MKRTLNKRNAKALPSHLKWIAIATVAVIVTGGCAYKQNKSIRDDNKIEGNNILGSYVYLDHANVLHTKTGCKAVYKERSLQYVEPIKLTELNRERITRICSQCVTETQLDSLYRITDPSNISYSKKLWLDLSAEFDVGTYEEFSEAMQDEARRRKLYNAVESDNCLPSFEEFSKNLGVE